MVIPIATTSLNGSRRRRKACITGSHCPGQGKQNAMKNSDKQNARIEHDRALRQVMIELLSDHTELFKLFSDNLSFKKWLGDTNFGVTYQAMRRGGVSGEVR